MIKNLKENTMVIIATIVLSACGGGGSSGAGNTTPPPTQGVSVSLTGIAAAGAPIIGSVTARDSLGVQFGPTTINPNGSYTLTATNGTAPFIVKATGTISGKAGTYYSSATVGTTIANITPLTDMIVAQATNKSPAVAFASCLPAACVQPSQTALNTAQTNVQGSLTNLLNTFNVPANTNLMTGSFTAGAVVGQSPVDILLDAITVTPIAATPTSFIITANSALTGLPANTPLLTLPPVATPTPLPVNAALTPAVINTTTAMAAIQVGLTNLQNLFAVSAPLPTAPALTALFDPINFLMDGANSAAFANQITMVNGFPIGGKFSPPVAITSPDGKFPNDATHQWFKSDIGPTNPVVMLIIKNAAGVWLIAGNQRYFGVQTQAFAQQIISTSPLVPVNFSTGISFWINAGGANVSNAANNTALTAKGLTIATVSGPGLIGASGVAGPVTIFTSVAPALGVAGLQNIQSCNVAFAITINCLDTALAVPGHYVFNMIGTTPAVTPAVATPFNYTYNEANTVALPAPAALIAARFPVINTRTPATLAGLLSGVIITANWTAPAGQTPTGMGFYGGSAFLPLINQWTNLQGLAAGSTVNTSLTPPAFVGVVTTANIIVSSVDASGMAYDTLQMY